MLEEKSSSLSFCYGIEKTPTRRYLQNCKVLKIKIHCGFQLYTRKMVDLLSVKLYFRKKLCINYIIHFEVSSNANELLSSVYC